VCLLPRAGSLGNSRQQAGAE